MKFHLKVQYDDEDDDVNINKLAPVLNQLSMEETDNLDDILYTFFTEHFQKSNGFEDEVGTLPATLNYAIWRRSALYHQIKIKPLIFYELYFKYRIELLQNLNLHYSYKTAEHFHFVAFLVLPLFTHLSEGTSWNVDTGFFFSFKKFVGARTAHFGIKRSYAKRHETLGGKFNFRRKVRKKRFEEY